MNRRIFVAGAVVLMPVITLAQPPKRIRRIGFLGGSEQNNSGPATLRDGLRTLGYAEGRDYLLDVKWGRGDPKRAFALATELVSLSVEVIVAQGSESTAAAKQATTSIPIVFTGPSYPVEEGLVASFARPGGNITGITAAMSDTVAKHLQLLRDVAPALADIAVVWSPANPGHTFAFPDTERAAAALRLKVHSVPVANQDDAESALTTIARVKPGALIVQPAPGSQEYIQRISALAATLRIPSISITKQFAERGLLMSYGADQSDFQLRAARYVDRILRGARPADLPVERPTKFVLVINMKTAKAIGLTVPQGLLLRADEVIH